MGQVVGRRGFVCFVRPYRNRTCDLGIKSCKYAVTRQARNHAQIVHKPAPLELIRLSVTYNELQCVLHSYGRFTDARSARRWQGVT